MTAKSLTKYSKFAVKLILANMVYFSLATVTSLTNQFQKVSHISVSTFPSHHHSVAYYKKWKCLDICLIYVQVSTTTDGLDADLWKDGLFKSKVTRYLCFTRVFSKENVS